MLECELSWDWVTGWYHWIHWRNWLLLSLGMTSEGRYNLALKLGKTTTQLLFVSDDNASGMQKENKTTVCGLNVIDSNKLRFDSGLKS